MSEYSDSERNEFYAKVKEILKEPITSREQAEKHDQLEYKITTTRSDILQKNPINGSYDLNHLAQIHYKLFEGIQDFAGKERDFDINKSIPSPEGKREVGYFLPAKKINLAFEDFSNEIKNSNFLKGLNKDQFIDKFTDLYAKINEIHPFEEGNGRSTKLMMSKLANDAGYKVNFDQLEKREWNYACKRSLSNQTRFHGSDEITMTRDIQLLKNAMSKIISKLEKVQVDINDEKLIIKNKAFDMVPNAQIHQATSGKYEGRIVAVTDNLIAQRLGDYSKHFVIHDKNNFNPVPKLNEVVTITRKADSVKLENCKIDEFQKSKGLKR